MVNDESHKYLIINQLQTIEIRLFSLNYLVSVHLVEKRNIIEMPSKAIKQRIIKSEKNKNFEG